MSHSKELVAEALCELLHDYSQYKTELDIKNSEIGAGTLEDSLPDFTSWLTRTLSTKSNNRGKSK